MSLALVTYAVVSSKFHLVFALISIRQSRIASVWCPSFGEMGKSMRAASGTTTGGGFSSIAGQHSKA